MKKFEKELATLKRRIVEMGDLAQSMIDLAMKALTDHNADVFEELLEEENRIDKMQVELDTEAIRLLTIYGPVAADLRFILMVSRTNMALERMGDQAVNMCEDIQLLSAAPESIPPELPKMAKLVRGMVRDALQAFYLEDVRKAEETMATDDLVDAINDQIVRDLLASAKDIASALALILIARSLERVADYATNICEEVIYIVKGADVRHGESFRPGGMK